MVLGMFDYSIESIVRMCFRADASKSVIIDKSTLHRSLMHLASDKAHPDLKSWALVVISQALLSNDGANRLHLSQHEAGHAKPQKSRQLEEMVELIPIAKSAEKAKSQGIRYFNKVASREHNCDSNKVKRATKLYLKLQKMAAEQEK